MKILTLLESFDWIEAIGLRSDPISRRVSLPGDEGLVFTVRWPEILPYQVPYFANLFLPGDPSKIDECLFLLTDNGASGELNFELACRMLDILRTSHGENRTLLDSPAYLLSHCDSVEARMLVTMAVLFSWDCYVVPQHGRYFIWIDDDDAADVWCQNRQDYDVLVTRFKQFGVIPEEAPELGANG